MNFIKFKNGHYLSDQFSSVDIDALWNKLISYLKDNSSAFSNVYFNKKEKFIKINYLNEAQFLDIIKSINFNNELKKNLIRTIKLKLKFNETKKSLEIVDDANTNEIMYSISCNNKVNFKNSLFFDEESIEDYSNDFNDTAFKNCQYVVIMFSYDATESKYNKNTETTKTDFKKEELFLCYNLDSKKIENLTFESTINKNKFIDISKLINAFNENSYDQISTKTIEDENYVNMYQFSNIKYSISEFKMLNRSELDFMNFKSFANSTMYSNFIEKLNKKSINIEE